MKRPKNMTKYFGVVLILLFFAACEHELLKEYDPISLPGAPALDASVSGVQDSAFVLNYTLGAAGWLSVAVVPGADLEVPSQDDMKFRRVANAVRSYHFEEEGGSGTLVVDSLLKQNTTYTVFAMSTSVDGISGTVWASAFTTSDGNAPMPSAVSPAVSSAASQDLDFEVLLTFNEAVLVENEEGFVFRYLNIVTLEFTDVPAETVTVSGNTIRLTQGHEPIPGQYVFLTILPNTVKDLTGNFHPGISSGLTPAFAFAGLYWRTAFIPLEYEGVLPDTDEAVQDPDFVVELFYDVPMDFYRNSAGAAVYNQKRVHVYYTMGPTTITVEVPGDHIAFNNNVVTIVPPRTPVFGETISVAVDSAAFRTRYGSPVAEIPVGEIEWLLSYGYARDLILGDYVIGSMVSHWDGPIDLEIEVNITAHESDPNKVWLNGIFGSTIPVEGIFNGDFATLTIPSEQLLSTGAPFEGYTFEVYNAYDGDAGAIGDIQADGTIEMWGLGFWIVEAGAWWDLFPESTWTPVSEKSFSLDTQDVKLPMKTRSTNKQVAR